jgi:hypothetical protein
MDRSPNSQTVSFFLEHDANGQLDLDPPYQRRSVWSDDFRRFFIDSLLRDYPSPPIYLDVETRIGVPTVYHVLDGKQRLLALIGFSKDEFHLGDYLDDRGLSKPYFSQLPTEMQKAFVRYKLIVENLTNTTEEELKQAFDRLNRNVSRLNRQELRNAQFEGEFIDRMENLTRARFWNKTGVTSTTNVRRMRDVEYVSELFLLTMHGIADGNQDVLDDYYAKYDEGIPDEDESIERYETVLDWLDDLELDWRHTRWRNLTDLYGLWAATLMVLDETGDVPDAEHAVTVLQEFGEKLENPSDVDVLRYADAARQGGNKDSNRVIRATILADLLRGDEG